MGDEKTKRVRCPNCGNYWYIKTKNGNSIKMNCPYCGSFVEAQVIEEKEAEK